MADWGNVDKALLQADFVEKVTNLLDALSAQGTDYRVYFGFRSFAEQSALYQKYLMGGPRAAPPGKSRHNIGRAVDVVRIVDGTQNWQPEFYAALQNYAPTYGLGTGHVYGDYGHVSDDGN